MQAGRHIDADAVRWCRNVRRLLAAYAFDVVERGHEIRSHLCPGRLGNPHGGRPGTIEGADFSINADTARWTCHACGTSGDDFDFVQAVEGCDFPTATAKLAEIYGSSSPLTVPRPVAPVSPPALTVDHAAVWAGLDRRSVGGERYLLVQRGIDPAALRHADLIRFDRHGNICVALRDLVTGEIVGIQRRRIDGSEPKITSDRGSRITGAYLGLRAPALDRNGVDVAIVVEGLADTLVAHLEWPGCAIYGAPGAGQVPRIVERVAPIVAAVRGWIVLVPDDDEPAVEACVTAIIAARRFGLDDHRGIHLADLGGHHDLAAAYRAGWRWRWPAEIAGRDDGRSS